MAFDRSCGDKNVTQQYIVSIDGLRAVAVLAVLLFHLDVALLSGGYIGVDIFFVISGFLITGNIVRDLKQGSFSFTAFYIRRVARLFPALFTTIAATLLASYWVLGPEDLAELGHTSILTVLSVSNILFWMQSGYFDAPAAFKPLLHTWSLAVEEQFYLVWPLLIWVTLKLAPVRVAGAIVLLLGASSLIAALLTVGDHPGAVFFLTPFRVHQFAVGALLALAGVGGRTGITSVAGAVGLAALLIVTVLAGDTKQSYLVTTLSPAIAASLGLKPNQGIEGL